MNCETENTHMIMILQKPELGRKELVKKKCHPNVSETFFERQLSSNSFYNYSCDNLRTGNILTGIPENITKPKYNSIRETGRR